MDHRRRFLESELTIYKGLPVCRVLGFRVLRFWGGYIGHRDSRVAI